MVFSSRAQIALHIVVPSTTPTSLSLMIFISAHFYMLKAAAHSGCTRYSSLFGSIGFAPQ